MIALDTNVIIRLLVGDDKQQSKSANQFLGSLTSANPALICREVLIEMVWVLERSYKFKRSHISNAIHELIGSNEIVVEDVDRVKDVVTEYESSPVDFSDLMIRSTANSLGATRVATFDKRFAELSKVILLTQ